MSTYFLIALGVVQYWCEDKIKSQSKNLRDCRGVSSPKGKGKKRKTTYICDTEKSLNNMNIRMAAKQREKSPVLVLYLLTFMIMLDFF